MSIPCDPRWDAFQERLAAEREVRDAYQEHIAARRAAEGGEQATQPLIVYVQDPPAHWEEFRRAWIAWFEGSTATSHRWKAPQWAEYDAHCATCRRQFDDYHAAGGTVPTPEFALPSPDFSAYQDKYVADYLPAHNMTSVRQLTRRQRKYLRAVAAKQYYHLYPRRPYRPSQRWQDEMVPVTWRRLDNGEFVPTEWKTAERAGRIGS